MRVKTLLLIVLTISFAACKKGGKTPPMVNPTDTSTHVYLAGDYLVIKSSPDNPGAVNGFTYASYWKDSTLHTLDTANNLLASTIATNGTDIYIAGFIPVDNATGNSLLYYKNGNPVYYSDITIYGIQINKILCNGTDIYLTGRGFKNQVSVSGFWKNDDFVNFNSSTFIGSSIAVLGNDVYVVGEDFLAPNSTRAIYFKNGFPVSFAADSCQATDICVSGSDIYVCGYKESNGHTIAIYWKNGQEVDLPVEGIGAVANCIAIKGGDVYVGGSTNPISLYHHIATYWKNGKAVNLGSNSGDSEITGVTIHGNDVYFCGNLFGNSGTDQDDGGVYWENNVLHSPLKSCCGTDVRAIAVTSR